MFAETHRTHRTGMIVVLVLATFWGIVAARGNEADRTRPYPGNPHYWQHKGKPVLLLGGSKDDNLFQIPDLKEHLDEMVAVGANTIRNTMSDRPDHGFEVRAFHQRPDGTFDLEQWNEEYWRRFENMLRWTAERDIIVQIELWDMHDMLRPDYWAAIPWNPDRNVNYTFENTRLPRQPSQSVYRGGESVGRPHEFFCSVPALNNDEVLLGFQRRFIDRVLEHTLRYDHVLYCISNEIHTEYSPEWGWYWARHLRQRAREVGKGIEVTEMYWAPELTHRAHRDSLDRPEIYSFFEASQNSARLDPEENWNNLQFVYRYLKSQPRPINNTKIYGADGGSVWAGSTQNAQEKFWRNIFGGSASSRFHRPATGLGLSEAAKVHIKSLRILTDAMNVFVCEPRNDLLSDRSPNEAYCLAEPGRQYAVYFPDGGRVKLDVSEARGTLQVHWLHVGRSAWQEPQTVSAAGTLELKTPGKGHWAALVQLHP
jgi:hypothetical protein